MCNMYLFQLTAHDIFMFQASKVGSRAANQTLRKKRKRQSKECTCCEVKDEEPSLGKRKRLSKECTCCGATDEKEVEKNTPAKSPKVDSSKSKFFCINIGNN